MDVYLASYPKLPNGQCLKRGRRFPTKESVQSTHFALAARPFSVDSCICARMKATPASKFAVFGFRFFSFAMITYLEINHYCLKLPIQIGSLAKHGLGPGSCAVTLFRPGRQISDASDTARSSSAIVLRFRSCERQGIRSLSWSLT